MEGAEPQSGIAFAEHVCGEPELLFKAQVGSRGIGGGFVGHELSVEVGDFLVHLVGELVEGQEALLGVEGEVACEVAIRAVNMVVHDNSSGMEFDRHLHNQVRLMSGLGESRKLTCRPGLASS